MATPFFESLVNSLEEVIVVADLDSRILFINKAGEELLGLRSGQVRGENIAILMGNDPFMLPLLGKTMKEMRPISGKDMSLDVIKEHRFDFTVTPLIEKGNACGAIILLRRRDNFFKKDEDQFTSVMELLSTVAHEIKNPLAGIKGAAQLLGRKARGDDAKHLGIIIRETERLDEVVKSYLFAGRKPLFNRVNVHEVIEEALSVLGGELKKGRIALKRFYDPSLPLIKGDEGKLLQVFLNIIKNAREAMPSGGTLHVKTKPAYEYLIEKKKKVKMKFAVISIADTGAGIAPDDEEKIFLPFYTRKKEGTGLGLTISKKIVLDHKGLIKIRSESGKGTTVDLYLPFADF